MKKNGGRKSRDTLPLMMIIYQSLRSQSSNTFSVSNIHVWTENMGSGVFFLNMKLVNRSALFGEEIK